uniref:Uncharacterized protein n=1 Tax=Hyaloperonospora arabidopsidis (strain Emoy2) TaxID=559515 RepID=M4BWV1_HYAAE
MSHVCGRQSEDDVAKADLLAKPLRINDMKTERRHSWQLKASRMYSTLPLTPLMRKKSS